MRPTRSVVLPAGNGTTNVIGRAGKVCATAAKAVSTMSPRAEHATVRDLTLRRLICSWVIRPHSNARERASSMSTSGIARKISTAIMIIRKRNALGVPFHCCDIHMPNHSPAMVMKPT
jgi:hypothetical protein